MKAYVTFQILPTEFLKGLGYTAKKFAIECASQRQKEDVLADLCSLEGISYLSVRQTKPHGRIMLPATNYAKDIHL